eukprot:667278_1
MTITAMDSNQAKFFSAIKRKDFEAIRHLLSTGQVDVNGTDAKGQTALHGAKGNAEIVRILLEDPRIDMYKANTNDDRTPLISAVEEGYTEVVRIILNNPNIDMNKATRNFLYNPLAFAISVKHTEIVRVLLENKSFDVDEIFMKCDGQSMLSYAAEKGCTVAVRIIMKNANIDVNIVDISSQLTPLELAVVNGHAD